MYIAQTKLERITCTFSAKSCYPCLVYIHEEIRIRDKSMDNQKFMETVWLIQGLLLRGAGIEQWREHLPPTNVAWVRSLDSHQMLVVGSHPCSKRFLSGYTSFPRSSITNNSKFKFVQESAPTSPILEIH